MELVKVAAAIVAAGLIAGCAPGAGGPETLQADPTVASADDSLAGEMTGTAEGEMGDVTGTPIPPP